MRQNIVYLLAVVVAIIVVTQAVPRQHQGSWNNNYYRSPNISHHMIVGNRVRGDRLVTRKTVFKSSSWFQTLTMDKTFDISRYDRITMIKALDQKTNGNGAFATVLRGGLGYSTVTLHFRSQKGHSINFVVEIYAKG